jgi:hypothetical protein
MNAVPIPVGVLLPDKYSERDGDTYGWIRGIADFRKVVTGLGV